MAQAFEDTNSFDEGANVSRPFDGEIARFIAQGRPNTPQEIEAGRLIAAEMSVRALLELIGENPERDGLKDTPVRFVKMLRERTEGYNQSPEEILARNFTQDDAGVAYGGMVVLAGTEFHSLCEHHLAPFYGEADIVYIPNESGRIVGISKLARLVDCFAKRLQVQERLTAQITDAIETHLQPRGAMVVVRARHTCICSRGIGKQNSRLITSEMRGVFKTDLGARQEALRLMEEGR